MLSLILCVLMLLFAGAGDAAAQPQEQKIAYTGPSELEFGESRIVRPSTINSPPRFGSAINPTRATPGQNWPTSSDLEKLFQAQPLSTEVQARFQKPTGALAEPAAAPPPSTPPNVRPAPSIGEREDATSSLPAVAKAASNARREWFAWWEKCRPRVSDRTHASKAVRQFHRRVPGRQVRHTTTASTRTKEAAAASSSDRSHTPLVSPRLNVMLACPAGQSSNCKIASQRIPLTDANVRHPPAAIRIGSAEQVKRRRARLTSIGAPDAVRLVVVRNRRDQRKAARWGTACKARPLERS